MTDPSVEASSDREVTVNATNVVVGPAIGVGFDPVVGSPVSLDERTAGDPVVVVGSQTPALGELSDVKTTGKEVGPQSFVRGSDGIWRPIKASTIQPDALAFAFTQPVPSLLWLITHPLPFEPAGVEVVGGAGPDDRSLLHPQRVTRFPGTQRIRLDFTQPMMGVAKFS